MGTTTPTISDWTKAAPEAPIYQGETYSVAMTGYNAVPEQTDNDPMTTASGAVSNPEIVAARSQDLADELPFGTVIEIIPSAATSTRSCGLSVVGDGIGLRVISDTMHSRKRNQIDILFGVDSTVRLGKKIMNQAVVFGVCKDVEIRVVGHIDMAHIPETQMTLRTAVGKAPLAFGK
ncbi:MAG: hypothetical protein Q8R25_00430 [bacterium]|nr:hypothetical protein [bacterium]